VLPNRFVETTMAAHMETVSRCDDKVGVIATVFRSIRQAYIIQKHPLREKIW
jgi:hypothetical protein